MSRIRVEMPERPRHHARGRKLQEARDNLEGTFDGLADAYAEDHLRGLAMLSTYLDDKIAAEVADLRSYNTSWAEIGASLGISKQAAQQRFKDRRD
jgi:hypothetical protein